MLCSGVLENATELPNQQYVMKLMLTITCIKIKMLNKCCNYTMCRKNTPTTSMCLQCSLTAWDNPGTDF